MCGGKGLFQVEDLPVGPRWFCTEKHFAEYAGLPVKEFGYYGFEAESFEAMTEKDGIIVCDSCNNDVESDRQYGALTIECGNCGNTLYQDDSYDKFDMGDFYGAESFEATVPPSKYGYSKYGPQIICDGCGKKQYIKGELRRMVEKGSWDKDLKRYSEEYPHRFSGQICENDNCDFALCKDCYPIGLERYDENGKTNWKRFFYRIGDKEDGVIYCDNCFGDPVGSQIIEGEHGGDAEESYERWDAWLYQVGYAPTNWKRKDEWRQDSHGEIPHWYWNAESFEAEKQLKLPLAFSTHNVNSAMCIAANPYFSSGLCYDESNPQVDRYGNRRGSYGGYGYGEPTCIHCKQVWNKMSLEETGAWKQAFVDWNDEYDKDISFEAEGELEREYFTRFGDERGGKEWGEYTFTWFNDVGDWKPIREDTKGWDDWDYADFREQKEYELVNDMLSDSDSDLYGWIENHEYGDQKELYTSYEVLNEDGKKEVLGLLISWEEPEDVEQKIQYYKKEPFHKLEFLAESFEAEEPYDEPASCGNCDWYGMSSELVWGKNPRIIKKTGKSYSKPQCPKCSYSSWFWSNEEPAWLQAESKKLVQCKGHLPSCKKMIDPNRTWWIDEKGEEWPALDEYGEEGYCDDCIGYSIDSHSWALAQGHDAESFEAMSLNEEHICFICGATKEDIEGVDDMMSTKGGDACKTCAEEYGYEWPDDMIYLDAETFEAEKLHPGLYRYKGKIGLRKGWTECQSCDGLVKLNDINWYYIKNYGQATVCDSCVGKYNSYYKKDRLSKGGRHGELAIMQFMEQDKKSAETFNAESFEAESHTDEEYEYIGKGQFILSESRLHKGIAQSPKYRKNHKLQYVPIGEGEPIRHQEGVGYTDSNSKAYVIPDYHRGKEWWICGVCGDRFSNVVGKTFQEGIGRERALMCNHKNMRDRNVEVDGQFTFYGGWDAWGAESKKLPPVEKAIDTGIASGATMEGLDLALGAESFSDEFSPLEMAAEELKIPQEVIMWKIDGKEYQISSEGCEGGFRTHCVYVFGDTMSEKEADAVESWLIKHFNPSEMEYCDDQRTWFFTPNKRFKEWLENRQCEDGEHEWSNDYVRDTVYDDDETGGVTFGQRCLYCDVERRGSLSGDVHWDMAAEWADEHPCEHCGSTDIDYGNNWKCHDCGRYAAESFKGEGTLEPCPHDAGIDSEEVSWLGEGDRVVHITGRCRDCSAEGEGYVQIEFEDGERWKDEMAAEEPSVYYWVKTEMQNRHPITEPDLDQILHMVSLNVPITDIEYGMEQAEEMGDEPTYIMLELAHRKAKFIKKYQAEEYKVADEDWAGQSCEDCYEEIKLGDSVHDDGYGILICKKCYSNYKIPCRNWGCDKRFKDDELEAEHRQEKCYECEGEGWIVTHYTPATYHDPADVDGEDCEECGGEGLVCFNAESFSADEDNTIRQQAIDTIEARVADYSTHEDVNRYEGNPNQYLYFKLRYSWDNHPEDREEIIQQYIRGIQDGRIDPSNPLPHGAPNQHLPSQWDAESYTYREWKDLMPSEQETFKEEAKLESQCEAKDCTNFGEFGIDIFTDKEEEDWVEHKRLCKQHKDELITDKSRYYFVDWPSISLDEYDEGDWEGVWSFTMGGISITMSDEATQQLDEAPEDVQIAFQKMMGFEGMEAESNGDKQLDLAVKRTKMSALRTGLAITTFGIVLWNLWTNKKQEKQISDIMGLV